jgi:hypothetical protein
MYELRIGRIHPLLIRNEMECNIRERGAGVREWGIQFPPHPHPLPNMENQKGTSATRS